MTEQKKSVQKVKLEKLLEEAKGEKGHRYGLQYVRTDVDNAKSGMTAYKLAASWTEEEKAFVKSLKAGDELVITKVERSYTDKDGTVKSVWDLSTLGDVSEYVPKQAKKPWEGKKGGGGWSPQDNLSAKIGGLIHDAVAMLGAGCTVSQVGKVTRDLLREAYSIEAEAASGVFKEGKKSEASSVTKSSVKEPVHVQEDVQDNYFDNIDEVDW